MTAGVVILLDVDNKSLDGDHILADLRRHLPRELGSAGMQCYGSVLETLYRENGYVDFPGPSSASRSNPTVPAWPKIARCRSPRS